MQIGIRIGFNLDMSSNTYGKYPDDLVNTAFTFDFLGHREDPFLTRGYPIAFDYPLLGFVRMSTTQHTPQLMEDIVVNAAECLGCYHMAVVVGPSSEHSIEFSDQDFHRGTHMFADQRPNLADEGLNALY